MNSNNIFFKIVVGVVLVGYMAFIFYQSLKGGLAYKKEFENFKNSHKHYETMVDGGYWVGVMVAMAVLAFVFDIRTVYSPVGISPTLNLNSYFPLSPTVV